MTLSAEQIFIIILTGLIGIIAFFLKDAKKQNDDKHRELENKVDAIKDSFAKEIEKIRDNYATLVSSLPHTYVLRDDFLRAISNLDMKMDKVASDVGELNKNVSKLLAGGTDREH